jgi:hypothetical protein
MKHPEKIRLIRAAGALLGGVSAIFTSLMTYVTLRIFSKDHDPDYLHFITSHFLVSLPFSICFLSDFPMRFTGSRKARKTIMKHLTFTNVLSHGILGTTFMLASIPQDINAYPSYFWFTIGVVAFFLGGAKLAELMTYGLIYFSSIVYFMLVHSDFSSDEKMTLQVMLYQLFLFTPIALSTRNRVGAIKHAFKQLEKVFYPHQIRMIRKSMELEQTMPTGPGEACVICFDIISSSSIQHENVKNFFRRIFARCSTHMNDGYNGIDLVAGGYRIKEMGDGFLCSVGYPFKSKTGHLAKDALDLAERFFEAFQEEVRLLDYSQPIHCAIGMALDSISGFYPESGAKEYDLHGRSIILATRYEAMSRTLLMDHPPQSIMILHERVWNSLTKEEREDFLEVNLKEQDMAVRDDPGASRLFYKFLKPNDSSIPSVHKGAA